MSQQDEQKVNYTLGVKVLASLVALGIVTGGPVLVAAFVIIYIRIVELLWQVAH
ncbi:hypothetical protein LCGC14_2222700 [marine sediment metagenome]|uniref:Uncharacterized protein n=1 Tax=marine sediment metagenome TaxID=412755 RepID=A0A0F9DAL3_9ZZZZ